MTKTVRPILFLLLPLMLSGCFHRRSAPPLPPQAQAPPVQQQAPVTTTPVTPPPQPATPAPAPTTKAEEKPEPPKPAPKPRRPAQSARRTKPATKTPADSGNSTTASSSTSPAATAPTKPAPAPVQQAAVGEGNGAMGSPIGQLTSGDTGNSAQKHKEALQTIENTAQGVNNLKRSLSEQEQETVVQIKTFLKQAKQALNAEDVDGALNLANKAKVLLTELTK